MDKTVTTDEITAELKKYNEISISVGTLIVSVKSSEEPLQTVKETTFEIIEKIQGRTITQHDYQ